jgi:putative nucleotidyltransferase with HDIG domain
MRQRAKQILLKTDIDKLPSLPHCLLSLLDMCHTETLPLDRLASLLRYDPALYMRVCASMHHAGLKQTEVKMVDALRMLDRNRLQSIATNAATHQFFSRISHERTEFIKQHWQHSLLCAHVAEAIATDIEYAHPEEAYKAGLLHDIGQLILEGAFPNKYTTTFAHLSEDVYFHNLEQDEFETTHQEVGSECMRKHGCDSFLADAVLYHHEHASSMLDAHPLAKIIHIANLLSSDHFKDSDSVVFESADMLLGMGKKPLLKIVKQSSQTVKQIAESLEIEIPADGIDGDTAKQIISREQNKQLLLAEQVRNIALLDSVNQTVARNTDSDLGNITREQCQLLFGISDCILFLYDATTDCLKAHTETSHSHVNELAIPLEPKRSLVTDALLEKQIIKSFDYHYPDLSVIDRQLIDLYNKQGMMCLPMMLENRPVGCIALAVDEIQQSFLTKQSALLNQFANTMASSLKASGQAPGIVTSQGDAQDALTTRIHEVVHEVRNPLSIINNYLEILSFKLETENPAQDEIRTIKTEIERVGNIISRLAAGEQAAEQAAEVDINQLISELSQMYQASLIADKRIQLSLELSDEPPVITSNSNAIKQIYTNLVKNAVEALPAKGKIMVYTLDNVNVDGKQFIEISVADNGPGIPADILPKLFSPVETTKQGEHAGLGLTIVKNLVSELHGSIRCRSSTQGTSFYVLLPKN